MQVFILVPKQDALQWTRLLEALGHEVGAGLPGSCLRGFHPIPLASLTHASDGLPRSSMPMAVSGLVPTFLYSLIIML